MDCDLAINNLKGHGPAKPSDVMLTVLCCYCRTQAGPLTGNRLSSMAAKGGTTSSAFAGGAMGIAPPGGINLPDGTPAKTDSPKAPVKAAEVDLLSFDDMGISGTAGSVLEHPVARHSTQQSV